MSSVFLNSKYSKHIKELIKFGFSSGIVLVFKLCLSWVLLKFVFAELAYGIVHVIVFFFSYFTHSRLTFKSPMSFKGAYKYFLAVILFKVLDYSLFVVAFRYFEVKELWSIVLATMFVTVFRFLVVRSTFKQSIDRGIDKQTKSLND